jgi:hypothetical protein
MIPNPELSFDRAFPYFQTLLAATGQSRSAKYHVRVEPVICPLVQNGQAFAQISVSSTPPDVVQNPYGGLESLLNHHLILGQNHVAPEQAANGIAVYRPLAPDDPLVGLLKPGPLQGTPPSRLSFSVFNSSDGAAPAPIMPGQMLPLVATVNYDGSGLHVQYYPGAGKYLSTPRTTTS